MIRRIDNLFLKKYRPYRDWYQECGAYTVYLEGCITDNPHERAPRPRDRRGRVHGIIPAGAPFASTVCLLFKTSNIYICTTFLYCFTYNFAGLISGEELCHSGDNGHSAGLEETWESHSQAQCTCGLPMWVQDAP